MPLVWVTGNSGTGKSTACSALRRLGYSAFDADEDGYSRWVHRRTGLVVVDHPDPVPARWLNDHGWQISREKVAALRAESESATVFLCGSAENEADVRDQFDLIVCMVIDESTLKQRLATRTTNDFGKNPEELEAALYWNPRQESGYRRLGAVIVDGARPIDTVVEAILAATQRTPPSRTPHKLAIDRRSAEAVVRHHCNSDDFDLRFLLP